MDQYNEEYFIRGKKAGVSLYENYRWLPDLTRPMVRAIVDHLRVRPADTVLDFGCARGYTVRALREFGYKGFGVDGSHWAVQNCDDAVRAYVGHVGDPPAMSEGEFDWVVAKDVLEHVPNVLRIVGILMRAAARGVFAVVPLSLINGAPYVVGEYERDATHVHRLTLDTWALMFLQPGWRVEMAYRIRGVKDNYAHHAKGNGFITARRID